MAFPAISFILFSALLYAAIPFVVLDSKSPTGNIVDSFFLATVAFSTLFCFGRFFDSARRLVLLDKELFFYSVMNLIGFPSFVYAVSASRGGRNQLWSVVLIYFLVANFLLGFLAKEDAMRATQAIPCMGESCQPQTPEA